MREKVFRHNLTSIGAPAETVEYSTDLRKINVNSRQITNIMKLCLFFTNGIGSAVSKELVDKALHFCLCIISALCYMITLAQAKTLAKMFNINFKRTPLYEWHFGLNVELEHGTKYGSLTNVTNNDLVTTARIVIAHLKESPRYYKYLREMQDSF